MSAIASILTTRWRPDLWSHRLKLALGLSHAMINILALRNLVHDRVRLAATLVGIVFAVVLVSVQLGLFLGFAQTTCGIISHSGADLWLMAPHTTNVDEAIPIADRKAIQRHCGSVT